VSREQEKARIRAKLSDADREFMDAVIATFPGAKLKAIRFSDGETIGKMKEIDSE